MLFVRDKGQMGNNILHYGHLYAWARERGRTTMSLRFAYKYPYFRICKTRWHSYLTYLTVKNLGRLRLIKTLNFQDTMMPFDVIDKTLQRHDNAIVEGWPVRFYDLFLKYREEITDVFAFLPHIEKHASRYIAQREKETGSTARLGVHIRRGDYAKHMGGKFYYDDDTYISLIRQWVEMQEARHLNIYICTNDSRLNKMAYRQAVAAMAKKEGKTISCHFPAGNAGQDLCLLSKMDCLIGPPSTYSLVAAMYHDTPIYFIRQADAPLAFHRFEDYFYYDDPRIAPKY